MKITATFYTILIVALLLASPVRATTYYIDWVNGNDTNNGTSKETPWKRAPGMRGCWVGDTGGNCNAKRVSGGKPGDQFILKGGVTWPRDALSWDWYFGSGTEANPIYFGVDKTWYAGTEWSRPILDAENGRPNQSPESIASMMRVYGKWLVVDDIEFKGIAQQTDNGFNMLRIGTSLASGGEVKNCYFHGWSRVDGLTLDTGIVLTSALISESPDMNLKIHDNVWDGSDTTQDMAMAYKGSAGHFYNNYICKMVNGIVTSNGRYFWGNTFKDIAVSAANKSCSGYPNGYFSFDCTSHGNSIENMSAQSIIYNNLFQNTGGGVTLWTQPKLNYVDYIFNNVIINDANQGLQVSNQTLIEGNTATVYVFNNTFQGKSGAPGARVNGPAHIAPYLYAMTVLNNHLIGDVPSVVFNKVTNQTQSSTIGMSNTEATSAGYVETGTLPYFPPANGSTVGSGEDLQSIAAGIPSTIVSDAATAALSDTSCGVKYDEVNHIIIGTNKETVLRGSVWDVGAYEYPYKNHGSPKINVEPASELTSLSHAPRYGLTNT